MRLTAVALVSSTVTALSVVGIARAQTTTKSICQTGLSPVVALRGTLERIPVHGDALVGNLEGDSPDRCVSVYLPPSYASSPKRRYPVLYILHGYSGDDRSSFGWRKSFDNIPVGMETDLAARTAKEMILVMPDAFTAYQGSMYSSSVTTGDWETFISADLVSYVDNHFRTIARRESRGLAGHSMGGYGALRIGMKRPDVFSSIYALSPCCMVASLSPDPKLAAEAEAIHEPADVATLPFFARLMVAEAAAWSPDPQNPPFYFDLPTKNGVAQQDVMASRIANSLLAMVYQHVASLRKLHALAFDAGAQDIPAIDTTTRQLDSILTRFGIQHAFEVYDPGTHTSRIEERVEKNVLPFFSKNLVF